MDTFVVGQALGYADKYTFVPAGTEVHFFESAGKNLPLADGLAIVRARDTRPTKEDFYPEEEFSWLPNIRLLSFRWDESMILAAATRDHDYVVGDVIRSRYRQLPLCDGNTRTCTVKRGHTCSGVLGILSGALYVICCSGNATDSSPAVSHLPDCDGLDSLMNDDPNEAIRVVTRLDSVERAALMETPTHVAWELQFEAHSLVAATSEGRYEFFALYTRATLFEKSAYDADPELNAVRTQVEREIQDFAFKSEYHRKRFWNSLDHGQRESFALADTYIKGWATRRRLAS